MALSYSYRPKKTRATSKYVLHVFNRDLYKYTAKGSFNTIAEAKRKIRALEQENVTKYSHSDRRGQVSFKLYDPRPTGRENVRYTFAFNDEPKKSAPKKSTAKKSAPKKATARKPAKKAAAKKTAAKAGCRAPSGHKRTSCKRAACKTTVKNKRCQTRRSKKTGRFVKGKVSTYKR